MARAGTGISYRLADGRFAGAAEVRRAVADARGQASAEGRSRRTRSGPTLAALEDERRTAREARERERAERAAARQEEWEKARARREEEARCRRKVGRLAPIRIRHRQAKPPVFTFPKVSIPRARRRSPSWGPSVGADGFASLVLKVWSHGTHRHNGRGLFAAKAFYVLDPEKLDGPPGRAIMTNLVACDERSGRPSEYTPEWLAELFGRCDALEQFERDVARREKGEPRAQLFLHVMVALPNLPDVFFRQEAARAVIARLARAGLPYLAVMQKPSDMRGQRDGRNHHLHLLVSTRPFAADGPSSTQVSPLKDLDTLGPEGLRAWRQEIVDGFNAVLARAWLPQRYTARTLAERGLDRRGRWLQPPAAAAAPRPVEALADAAASLAAAAGRLASASARLAAAAAAHGQALAKACRQQAARQEQLADISARLGAAAAGAGRALPEGIVTVQLARRRWGMLGLRRLAATSDHTGALGLALRSLDQAGDGLAGLGTRLTMAKARKSDAPGARIGWAHALATEATDLGRRLKVASLWRVAEARHGLDRLTAPAPMSGEAPAGTVTARARLADQRARLAQALASLRVGAEGRIAALAAARRRLVVAALRRGPAVRGRLAEAKEHIGALGQQQRRAIDLSQRVAAAVEARRQALATDIADLGNARAHACHLGRRQRAAATERLLALAAGIGALERSQARAGAASSRLAKARAVLARHLVEGLHRLRQLARRRAEARRRLVARVADLCAAAAGLPMATDRMGASSPVAAAHPVGPGTLARPAPLLRLAEASGQRAQVVGRHGAALAQRVQGISARALRLRTVQDRLGQALAGQRGRLARGLDVAASISARLTALRRRREEGLARTIVTVEATLVHVGESRTSANEAARRLAERLRREAETLRAQIGRLLALWALLERLRQRTRQQALQRARAEAAKREAARREAERVAAERATGVGQAEAGRQPALERAQGSPIREPLRPAEAAHARGWPKVEGTRKAPDAAGGRDDPGGPPRDPDAGPEPPGGFDPRLLAHLRSRGRGR